MADALGQGPTPKRPSYASLEIFDCDGGQQVLTPSLPSPLKEKIEKSPRSPTTLAQIETRLENAEKRREEFRQWLLQKSRYKSSAAARSADERRNRRLEKLQRKLESAQVQREETLAAVKGRATYFLQRREGALLRLAERQELLAVKLRDQLEAAESRRHALKEAERDRLKMHERLVLSRLAMSREEGSNEEQRRRLEERLQAAEQARIARLAETAAKAGEKVQRAKEVSQLTKAMLIQDAEARRESLNKRQASAAERRSARRSQSGSPASTESSETTLAQQTSAFQKAAAQQDEEEELQMQPEVQPHVQAFLARPEGSSAAGKAPQPAQGDTDLALQWRQQQQQEGSNAVHVMDMVAAAPLPLPRHLGLPQEDRLPRCLSRELAKELAAQEDLPRALSRDLARDLAILEGHPGGLQPLDSPKPPRARDVSKDLLKTCSRDLGADPVVSRDSSFSNEVAGLPTGLRLPAGGLTRGLSGIKAMSRPGSRAGSRSGTPRAAAAAAAQQGAADHEFHHRLEALRRHISSRKLQQLWRTFCKKRRTTAALTAALVETGVTGLALPAAAQQAKAEPSHAAPAPAGTTATSPTPIPGAKAAAAAAAVPAAPSVFIGGMSPSRGSPRGAALENFEQFAMTLRASNTLKAAQALLKRFEVRLHARGVASSSCNKLLRHLFPKTPKDKPIERYPARVFLCAYMIIKHPEVVFNSMGHREGLLAEAAKDMIGHFERLLDRILEPPSGQDTPAGANPSYLSASPTAQGILSYRAEHGGRGGSGGGAGVAHGAGSGVPGLLHPYSSIGEYLVHFDESWLRYLDQFVAWKCEDAASLENELIRIAVEMEKSMRRKCRNRHRVRSSSDLQAVIDQVSHDHELLRERILKLAGQPGVDRLEAALEAARSAVLAETESESANESESDRSGQNSPQKCKAAGSSASSPRLGSSTFQPAAAVPARSSVTAVAAAAPAGDSAAAAPAATAAAPQAQPAPASKAAAKPAGLARGWLKPSPAAKPAAASATTPAAAGSAQPALTSSTGAAAGGPLPSGAAAAAAASPPIASLASATASLAPVAGAPAGPAAATAGALANLQMVWELLHNPNYQLPADAEAVWQRAVDNSDGLDQLARMEASELEAMAPEQLVAFVRSRAKVIGEKVFWDNVRARLAAGLLSHSVTSQVVPLLSEVGLELAAVISDGPQAAALQREFSERALHERLDAVAAPGLAPRLLVLLGIFQRLASLLVELGAPARESAAIQAHTAMREELTSALQQFVAASAKATDGAPATSGVAGAAAADGSEAAKQLAASLARALQLLLAQLKLLKVDAANGRLQMLAKTLQGDGGVAYLQAKFASLYRLDDAAAASLTYRKQRLVEALPHTVAWLQNTATAIPAMQAYLSTAGVDLSAVFSAVAAAGPALQAAAAVPVTLRAGLRSSAAAAPPQPGAAAPVVQPVLPAQLLHWRGHVRLGVLKLVAGESAAVGPGLAETLAWDVERLHAAQNQFQLLLVTTASLLLVQQMRAAAAAAAGGPAAPAAAWPAAQRDAARRRLTTVLADPAMRLQDLVTELASLAGLSDVAQENQLRSAFLSIVDPSSAAYRSLSNGIASVLLLQLLFGRECLSAAAFSPRATGNYVISQVKGAAANILGRIGAAAAADDVAALGDKLVALCAVNEAVHEPVYSVLAAHE